MGKVQKKLPTKQAFGIADRIRGGAFKDRRSGERLAAGENKNFVRDTEGWANVPDSEKSPEK